MHLCSQDDETHEINTRVTVAALAGRDRHANIVRIYVRLFYLYCMGMIRYDGITVYLSFSTRNQCQKTHEKNARKSISVTKPAGNELNVRRKRPEYAKDIRSNLYITIASEHSRDKAFSRGKCITSSR